MKKLSFILVFLLTFPILAISQGYQFTEKVNLPHTSVKDQYRSGTCWSWSGISFFESEAQKNGVDVPDLAPMFVVRNMYKEKAVKYIRMQGKTNFGAGGELHDVQHCLKKYGIVPMDVYQGLNYGEKKHNHGELDMVLKNYCDGVIKAYENANKRGHGRISTAWINGLDGILDAYFGQLPQKFSFKGKEYTPKSFLKDYLKINPDNYVELSSFTHHPFYKPFILEIPDNWMWASVENVPLNDMMSIIDNAFKSGYTVAWAADVSEKGFVAKEGIAVIPAESKEDLGGTELSRWTNVSDKDFGSSEFKHKPMPEKTITQKMRQAEFNRQTTTDDHGMHLIGTAIDQNNTPYYIVKNSWNKYNKYDGYFYASKPYVAEKTTAIMVNKKAIPKAILKKLGLK